MIATGGRLHFASCSLLLVDEAVEIHAVSQSALQRSTMWVIILCLKILRFDAGEIGRGSVSQPSDWEANSARLWCRSLHASFANILLTRNSAIKSNLLPLLPALKKTLLFVADHRADKVGLEVDWDESVSIIPRCTSFLVMRCEILPKVGDKHGGGNLFRLFVRNLISNSFVLFPWGAEASIACLLLIWLPVVGA